MIGLQKVLKYHVKGKEIFVLYTETLIISKCKNIIRNIDTLTKLNSDVGQLCDGNDGGIRIGRELQTF